MQLGRLPRPPSAKFLKLGDYRNRALPKAPPAWKGTDGATFRMYRNDELGDCTCAAIANLASVQATAIGSCVGFTDQQVVDYYFDMTKGKDTGAVVVDVLARLAKKGFPSAPSYQIEGWASVEHELLDEVKSAAASFKGLYVGADLPISAQRAGTWDVVKGRDGVRGGWGGHAMVLVGYDKTGVLLATWGRVQKATWAWWYKYIDEAYAILDTGRRWQYGLDLKALRADLKALQAQK